MRKWLRRTIIVILLGLWLIFISLPLFAFMLAARNQLQVGDDPRSHIRIFLVQEQNAEGIGVEWTRPYRPNPACSQTSVNYFMWSGEPEPVLFCQCYDPETGAPLPVEASRCTPP